MEKHSRSMNCVSEGVVVLSFRWMVLFIFLIGIEVLLFYYFFPSLSSKLFTNPSKLSPSLSSPALPLSLFPSFSLSSPPPLLIHTYNIYTHFWIARDSVCVDVLYDCSGLLIYDLVSLLYVKLCILFSDQDEIRIEDHILEFVSNLIKICFRHEAMIGLILILYFICNHHSRIVNSKWFVWFVFLRVLNWIILVLSSYNFVSYVYIPALVSQP